MDDLSPWRKLGITDETLFTVDGLEYWKSVNVSNFMSNLVNILGQEERVLRSWVEFTSEKTDFPTMPISNDKTGQFIIDTMIIHLTKMYQAMDLMREYANYLRDSEENLL